MAWLAQGYARSAERRPLGRLANNPLRLGGPLWKTLSLAHVSCVRPRRGQGVLASVVLAMSGSMLGFFVQWNGRFTVHALNLGHKLVVTKPIKLASAANLATVDKHAQFLAD